MDIDDIIEMFNNNDLDVEKYFNDYQTFFKILKKKGLLDQIDPKNAVGSQDWQNEWMLWLYGENKEQFYRWIKEFFNDVKFEDGQAILELDDRGELSRLFNDGGRNDLSRSTIESILSGESDDYYRYDNTTDDVYRDVIEELNDKNTQRLYEYIVSSLNGVEIEPTTDVLEVIAEEQGHPEYVDVNAQTVIKIVDDKETMDYLLKDELSELKGELYSIHSNAYNSAYENEIWNNIWSELSNYFIGDGKWISRPHNYKKDTTVQTFELPIAKFEENVIDYLDGNKGYGNTGTLEYIGSYLGMLEENGDLLRLRVPDYPDSRIVDKNINEYFSDYI